VFGSEKYALPMTLDGVCLSCWCCFQMRIMSQTEPCTLLTLAGAMKDNVKVLKQGYLTILPACDKAGRQIVFVDRRVTTEYDPTTDEVSFGSTVPWLLSGLNVTSY
jgi:hypothetical protein